MLPQLEFNGNTIDLLILLHLLFALNLVSSKGSKNDLKSAITPILELFGLENIKIYATKSDVKKAPKHKTCVICGLFSRTYQQCFFN